MIRRKQHANLFTLPAVMLMFSCTLPACATPDAATSSGPLFTEVDVPFEHHWDKSAHPFLGAAVIDIDGDGAFEIFVGGGADAPDTLLRFTDGGFVDVIGDTGLSSNEATHGAKAIDMDADGDTDLLVARVDGVTLYLNQAGRFEAQTIPVDVPPQSEAFDIAIGDINRDGAADLYVSYFVAFPSFKSATFNDPDHAKLNRLLLNNGDNTFTDITNQTGTASHANTFCSVFVDLDNDGWQDLVVAQNTWEVEIYRNDGHLGFTPVPTDSGYGFWMGVGIGDYDNDGDQDLYFPNVGESIPAFLTTGDIRDDQRHTHDWLLLRNDGAMRFTTVTAESGLLNDGFAWGGVFEDVDLDGRLDLFVAQNYIKWPPHVVFKLPSRAFKNSDEGGVPHFNDAAPDWGLENPYFAQSSLIVDFDGDGYQDYLWVNMDGPLRAFRREPRGQFVNVVLDDNVANLGATVTVRVSGEEGYARQVVSGEGFLTDQSPVRAFAVPEDETVELLLRATWPDGVEINRAVQSGEQVRLLRSDLQ